MHTLLLKLQHMLPACFAALAIAPANVFGATPVYINNIAPFSYLENGRETGLVYDLLDQMATHAGMRSSISITAVPFKRIAMQLGLRQQSLGAIWRQPEVEQSYTWVLKLLEEPIMLVARSDTLADLSSMDTAKKLRVGVLLGSPAEIIARRLGFEHIEVTTSAASNASKLQRGRIDAWLAVPSVVAAAQRQIGDDLPLRFGPPIEKIAMYLICATQCKDVDLERWKRADLAMKKDGSYARVIDKYIHIQRQSAELAFSP